ncbi:MAG: hypothetical protein AB7N71_07540 [Phycisphaerae bacterium]
MNPSKKPFAGKMLIIIAPIVIAGCQCKRETERSRPDLGHTKEQPVANENVAAENSADNQNTNAGDVAATSQPSAETQPASAPTSQPVPESPKFVRVLQTDKISQDSRVIANVGTAKNELSLRTDNVRRLRILRQDVELDRSKSIVLRIDGQTFEWPANSSVTTFECSPNGVWSPARN